jgi:hypothetical protein
MFALVASFLAAALPLAASGPAPVRDDWELLGTRRVNLRAEKDVIAASHQGRFRAIRIEVEGGDLEMYIIRVVFGDGESFSPDARVQVREGSWSRTIDLPGNARVIRRIEFFYRSELRRGKAIVRAFGLGGEGAVGRDEHADHDEHGDHAGRPPEPGDRSAGRGAGGSAGGVRLQERAGRG